MSRPWEITDFYCEFEKAVKNSEPNKSVLLDTVFWDMPDNMKIWDGDIIEIKCVITRKPQEQ